MGAANGFLETIAFWLPFAILSLALIWETYATFKGFKGANGLVAVFSSSVAIITIPFFFVLGWMFGSWSEGWDIVWVLLKSIFYAWGSMFAIFGVLMAVLHLFERKI